MSAAPLNLKMLISRNIYICKLSHYRSLIIPTQSLFHAKNSWNAIFQKPFDQTKETNAYDFCEKYKYLGVKEKQDVLRHIGVKYSFDKEAAKKAASNFISVKDNQYEMTSKAAEKLRVTLIPKYNEALGMISRLNHGIKFLVDLRVDVLSLLSTLDHKDEDFVFLKTLSNNLKELLAFGFNVGFLVLERITWHSSCYMLQKISEYEAVHPMRHWADLRQRVGPYRRCYVFTHNAMPKEPIVMLHTALTEEISSSISSIVTLRQVSERSQDQQSIDAVENPSLIQAAIFYSITSTQKGLHGIELGNQLIKKVVGEILKEFPHISKFSSLSPIPGFRDWLLMEIKKAKYSTSIISNIFPVEELTKLGSSKGEDVWTTLAQLITSNQWASNSQLKELFRLPIMTMCAHYLAIEKRRLFALNSVAHFHLRNGAELWRINWAADLSPRGLDSSCGIMVNYRYYMEDTAENSQKYSQDYYIKISESVKNLLDASLASNNTSLAI